MTLEQLRIFVAVAEREHVTRAAAALNITQSVASGAIAGLELRHGVKLFSRVGRGIELTDAGRMFLDEARGVLARAASAELALQDYSDLKRGTLRVVASQTIAGYWLPARLAAFHRRYPAIELSVAIANTQGAARAVEEGDAELGFVEAAIDESALAKWPVAKDRMVAVGCNRVEAVTNEWLLAAEWVMREPGSGTRSTFEATIRARGLDPAALNVVLTLPSNEAVLSAVRSGMGNGVLSTLISEPALATHSVYEVPLGLPERSFYGIRHKERYRSRAADALVETVRGYAAASDWVI